MVTRCITRILAALAALSAPAAARSLMPVLPLADEGHSDYVVVLPADPTAGEAWAAAEFVDHVEKMTGARLPVTTAADPLPERAVLIGAGPHAAALGVEVDDALGGEGFIVRTVGNRLVIAGGRPRGTLYGVYAFLEHLGVRWWTPTETVVPRRPRLLVEPLDMREVPALETRNIMYAEGFDPASTVWYVRNRLNGNGWQPIEAQYGGDSLSAGIQGHNSIDLVEQAVGTLAEDMWALYRGERSHEEICPSSDAVVDACVASLVKLYREHPDTPYLMLAHEDNDAACQCPECAEIAKTSGRSAPWWRLVNRVAEGVAEEIPGARIASDAYGWTRTPPAFKLRDNVIIRFAPIEADFAHPLAAAGNPENKAVCQDIEAWAPKASAAMIWSYVGNRAHYLMPNPDFDSLVSNIRFFADHKAVGIFQQGTHVGPGTEFVGLRMWVQARALWNPHLDGGALIKEFLEGYYGPAAPAIAEYIDLMHRYGREHNYHLGRVTRMNAPFLQPDMIAQAEAILRKADAAAAGDPALQRRVRQAHMPIWYVLAKRGPLSRTWKATEQVNGPLDFAALAASLNRVAADYRITAVADPEAAEPFFQWLTDYGRLCAGGRAVLPRELAGADLSAIRLLQARQIDSGWLGREGWWVRDEAASDGWALKVPVSSWLIQHHFSPLEECAGADRFRLFIRVRGGAATGDWAAFVCGTRGGTVEVDAAALSDGAYHVFEVGTFEVADDMMMYIALSRPTVMDAVYLDCLWLEPAP
ncbi:MAG: DUF4838 domain-containing protein [Planctomycetes bacterium]|nr:DUF4838 domain-containing protein [Planctomycetota bacterium]